MRRCIPCAAWVMFWFAALPAFAQEDAREEKRVQGTARKIDSSLKKSHASLVSSDAEFLRRVTLDLTATLPSVDEARTFLSDASPEKRSVLVERLVKSDAFADFWSRMWCQILLGNYRELSANVNGKGVPGSLLRDSFEEFRLWLKKKILEDEPWPLIVAELVQATGMLSENPLVLHKAAAIGEGPFHLNYADSVSRSLLGMRISCARCHDHPFDQWTQEDYYGMAAFLIRVKPKPLGGSKENECADLEFFEEKDGELTMPESGKVLPASFLFGGKASTSEPRLLQLARFLGTKGNTQLPSNVVNRTWAWLMGRGFVEPVDDFNRTNRPVGGALLGTLTKEFMGNGYSLRYLVRSICESEGYQRSCAGGSDDPFSSAALRPLTGEQLFKSLVTACAGPQAPDFGAALVKKAWNDFRPHLVPLFGANRNWTEVTPLPGNTRLALLLRNGPIVNGLLNLEGGLVTRLAGEQRSAKDRLEELFLAVLTRSPSEEEAKRYAPLLTGDRSAIQDAVWALLNSTEFSTRH